MFSKVKSLRLTLGFWSVMEVRFSLLSRNPERQDFLSFNALSIILLNFFQIYFCILSVFAYMCTMCVDHVCTTYVYHLCILCVCACAVCTVCVCMCLYHVCWFPLEIRRGQRYSHLWTTLNVGDGNCALGPLEGQ